ncbi:hypothetical protein [Paenibacillus oleatilyticus]|uniref:hypothetical protein n=1 Tax=Paenibacillus oleatilyticus TaxID=2594886 RepID=UPI0020A6FA9C|nr:hypothetical protein [Paenibacillus oleatilyticus]
MDHHRTPLFTTLMQQNQEGILMATPDLSRVVPSRYDFDVTGHYSRGSVQPIVNDKKQDVVRTAGKQN